MSDERPQRRRPDRLGGHCILQPPLRADDPAHASRHERGADDGENRGEEDEHEMRGEHQGQHRAQRERDVHGRQHHHEIRRAHQRIVERAPCVPGDAAKRGADDDRAERRKKRQAERGAGAEQQTAEHVAAETVGAQPQQRRTRIARRLNEPPACQPVERDWRRPVLFVALLQLTYENPGVHKRGVPSSGGVAHVGHRGWRVQEAVEARVDCVRRDERRGEREQCDRADDGGARPAAGQADGKSHPSHGREDR